MNKEFWEGFKTGYLRAIPYGVVLCIGIVIGEYYALY
jgi:hypothetical protein